MIIITRDNIRGRDGMSEPPPPLPPKVRDEMYWQAQVIGLHTFGVLQSHRHPVAIHQHMCWNVSSSLNIVSVGVQLIHDCFSLVHAEGALLAGALNMQTYAYGSLDIMHIYININLTRKEWNLNLRM